MKVTKKTSIGEIINEKGEKAAKVLMEAGMGCVGCPMAQMESLEDGCKGHGLSDKEITEIVKELNK
jgi:hybrid cluster-associated redox disulfide protein